MNQLPVTQETRTGDNDLFAIAEAAFRDGYGLVGVLECGHPIVIDEDMFAVRDGRLCYAHPATGSYRDLLCPQCGERSLSICQLWRISA